MRRAKIVCTLGPGVASLEQIWRLVDAGMDVARLNFSHGDRTTHRRLFSYVRQASDELGKPVAILGDLSGPKIRVGEFEAGSIQLAQGEEVCFSPGDFPATRELISVTLPDFVREVSVGAKLFADDGLLEFQVLRIDGDQVHCRTIRGGPLKSRKGVNVPQGGDNLPALTEKDREDIAFGKELGVDYFALSFVRRASDVREAIELAGSIPIIAKIEKPRAIDNLEEICRSAAGLMVARGDLGVEVGPEKVPLLQKRMIQEMNHVGKPVITATQMLESMVSSPTPTRAEVSDVANAILDGTDAVMLSAETATGSYPIDAVRAMDRIIREVEDSVVQAGMLRPPSKVESAGFRRVVAHAAARAAIDMPLKAVAVYSYSGRSAALVSAHRPNTVIAGFSGDPAVMRRLALLWGVVPCVGEHLPTMDGLVSQAESTLLRKGLVREGDAIAITFGLSDGGPSGTTMLKLWTVRDCQ